MWKGIEGQERSFLCGWWCYCGVCADGGGVDRKHPRECKQQRVTQQCKSWPTFAWCSRRTTQAGWWRPAAACRSSGRTSSVATAPGAASDSDRRARSISRPCAQQNQPRAALASHCRHGSRREGGHERGSKRRTHMYTRIHTCTHAHAYIHAHMHTHTYMHTCTQTYIQ